jgi:hypothetical protein
MRHIFSIPSAWLLLASAVALATGPVATTADRKLQGVGTVGVDDVIQALRIPAGTSLLRKTV